MKTIEEKAKAYDKALRRAKSLYGENPVNSDRSKVCSIIFPQLKESEDERIRKEIKDIILSYRSNCISEGNHHFDECLAYLEKQKEQKPAAKSVIQEKGNEVMKAIEGVIRVYEKTQGGWIAGYDMDTLVVHLRKAFAALEKQKEPQLHWKPTEPELGALQTAIYVLTEENYPKAAEHLQDILNAFEQMSDYKVGDKISWKGKEYTIDACYPQPKQEWSVEDEDRIRQIERIAQAAGCTQKLQEEIHDWFKSLKNRGNFPKSNTNSPWKPSEEQMEALKEALETYKGFEEYDVMIRLYEQLKKLM